ncbi:MAG: dihydroorotate dehydrogenase electron transfer subunit [Endomicrobium sp.]|jgi:dihydroorotate dehydrogenase electron transfer subunit|nr:dihydroorotate dehydrogenase electron transfer subunit [Endomicrobium sp.]
MAKRFDKSYKIVYNKEIRANYFELKIEAGDVCKYCFPGQFFMISVPNVFLRRPFSICSADVKEKCVSFLYKVVGKGTKNLSDIKLGTLQLLGPLGKGYDLKLQVGSREDRKKTDDFSNVIVAGGTGIASVYFLALRLKKRGVLYYGAKSKSDLLYMDKFMEIGWKVLVATEDGSKGYKGYITDMLSRRLKLNDRIFVCGPIPMLEKVLQIAKKRSVSGFASLEAKMACGTGSCQGCAVKIDGQNKMTCKDGPVFRIEQVEL